MKHACGPTSTRHWRLAASRTVARVLMMAAALAGGCRSAPGGDSNRNGNGNDNGAGTVCGGIIGLPCPDAQYCRLDPGECCCDQRGVCTAIPDTCPTIFAPVCGCDGRTYGNECEAAAAGMSVDHAGECP